MADTPAQTEADQREMTHGDVVTHNGTDYEVTAVSHQDDAQGNKINFQYTIRNKAELDAERQAQAEADAAREKAEAEAQAQLEADQKARDELANTNLGAGQVPTPEGVKQNG